MDAKNWLDVLTLQSTLYIEEARLDYFFIYKHTNFYFGIKKKLSRLGVLK